jgi:hypothetical protein
VDAPRIAFGGGAKVRNPRLDASLDPRFPFPVSTAGKLGPPPLVPSLKLRAKGGVPGARHTSPAGTASRSARERDGPGPKEQSQALVPRRPASARASKHASKGAEAAGAKQRGTRVVIEFGVRKVVKDR